MIVLNNRVIAGRRITYMATLASRIDTAMANVKNCFEMARAVEPKPDQRNEMWKLCHNAAKEHHDLLNMQKEVDKEGEAF